MEQLKLKDMIPFADSCQNYICSVLNQLQVIKEIISTC